MKITKIVPDPKPLGSYPADDVTFLLRDVSDLVPELSTEEREQAIQRGVHYSEMLPVEYRPSVQYMRQFEAALQEHAESVATLAAIVAEKILNIRGRDVVLVSLARAGTPAAILLRRYIQYAYTLDIPHYSISIIRGKGFDENALLWLTQHYDSRNLVFVDGWTGKGAITKELAVACTHFNDAHDTQLNSELAVLTDPAFSAHIVGTHEDVLIPSACLNATVSGLLSRTFHRADIIGPHDFHGARYFSDLEDEDVSQRFIDTVARYFPRVQVQAMIGKQDELLETPLWRGAMSVQRIAAAFSIENINFVKPGRGETTRVLLRRMPWKILIHPEAKSESLRHILQLATERDVQVQEWADMDYACCGIIKKLG